MRADEAPEATAAAAVGVAEDVDGQTRPRGFSGPDQPDADILRRCIRCGFCLPTCPTYVETRRETSSPRGRIHLIEAVAEGHLDVTDPAFVDQMYECLDCRACEDVCPSGVRYGQLVETARAQIERARPRPAWQRAARVAAFDGLFADMRGMRLAGTMVRLYQRSGMRRLARGSGVLRRLGLASAEAMLPEMPADFVRPRNQVYPPLTGTARGRVALFAGCVMSTVFAQTDRATVRVLTANGYEVVAPEGQGCCGALTVHGGALERARAMARRNIAAFEAAGADYVVVNAAGCGSALKEYDRLLEDDPAWAERAAAFAERVRDMTELLGALEAEGALNTAFAPLPLRVTYQEPCHLAHAQRITQQPRRLLRAIPELELIEMEEPKLCCGSAGIYNLTRPVMADQLGQRKAGHITATGAEAVVTANPGCHMQLRATLAASGAPVPVLHIVDVLDAAYRGVNPLEAASAR
jgi:glycolate oxidase iron-sulfur subunit